jgi:hypothetical protein
MAPGGPEGLYGPPSGPGRHRRGVLPLPEPENPGRRASAANLAARGLWPGSFVEQLLSEEALGKTGYFEPRAVQFWRQRVQTLASGYHRLMVRMGLVGVLSTQLWHHTFLDSSLAEVR